MDRADPASQPVPPDPQPPDSSSPDSLAGPGAASEARSGADGGLDALVTEFLDRLEVEGSGALEALCDAHPGRAEGLRRRVRALHRLDLIPVESELRLPERLGRFEVRERLGEGAMGVVHRGRSAVDGEEVALKIVRPELMLFGDAKQRFEREARLAARLDHPALLGVREIGETDGLPWFATELVEGGSLAELVGLARREHAEARSITPAAVAELARRLSPDAGVEAGPTWRERVLEIAIAAAGALAHAHANGVLHRDVKPSNVLLHADGRAVLSDLGLAGEPAESSLSRSGSMVGSLPYLAPEVVDGARGDVRADVYALGVTLYEALTLRRPFEGATASQLMAAITLGAAPRAASLGADVDADLEAVLAKAMAREPERRYATMAELRLDLEAARAGRPTVARPLGALGRGVRWARSRPASASAVLLGALLASTLPLSFGAVQAAERRAAERSAEELRAALGEAQAERARADRSLEQAGRAVEVLLAETADVLLDDVPFMERLEAVLYERALDVLGELEPRAPQRAAEHARAARLALSAASARANLGDPEGARALLDEQLAGVERFRDEPGARELTFRLRLLRARLLQESGPDAAAAELAALLDGADPLPVGRVLEAEHLAAEIAGVRGRLGEELALLDAALLRAEAALAEAPDDVDLRRRFARLHGTRGETLIRLDRSTEAIEDLGTALAICDALQVADPEDLSLRGDRIALHVNRVLPLIALDRIDEARAGLEGIRPVADELAALFPGSRVHAQRQINVLVNLGFLDSKAGRPDSAEPHYEAALAKAREWIEAGRGDVGLARSALQASQNLAGTAHETGRLEKALEHVAASAPIQAWAAERAPDEPLLARIAISLRVIQCLSALGLDRPELADAALEGAEDVAPPLPESLRLLTEAMLMRAEALPDGERRVELEGRALGVLIRAVESGYANAGDLQFHPRLEPLRGLPGFPELEAGD